MSLQDRGKNEMVWFILSVFLIVFIVWTDYLADRTEAEDNRKFNEEIKHLPVERQAELWATKLRHDAERDLH